MIWFSLWLVTSSYAVNLGPMPGALCLQAAAEIGKGLATPPRAVMAEVMCVPTLVAPALRRAPEPPPKDGPSA